MIVLLFILLLGLSAGREDTDFFPLLNAKCEASCLKSSNKSCASACLKSRASWQKPGQCPQIGEEGGDVFGLACLNACRFDAECPYTDKCCPNSCGITCQNPSGLEHQIELPAKPHDVTVLNKKKGAGKGARGVALIRWTKPSEDAADAAAVHVLEARSHVGRHFSAPRLSEWAVWPAASELLENRVVGLRPRGLKLGTWYQFRVAIVNEVGSRGFSEPSAAFTPSGDPKPPSPPANFHVEIAKRSGQEDPPKWVLRWERPLHSDLPVQRYKVYWSRRISTTAHGSLLVHHHTMPSSASSYVLKDLQPDALYFLQVQALSQFGKARLKSDKAGVMLNTTVTAAATRRRKRTHGHH